MRLLKLPDSSMQLPRSGADVWRHCVFIKDTKDNWLSRLSRTARLLGEAPSDLRLRLVAPLLIVDPDAMEDDEE